MLFVWIVTLCCWAFTFADWPASVCDPEPYMSGGSAILTSASNSVSRCILEQTFQSLVYVRLGRSHGRDKASDSQLSLLLLPKEGSAFANVDVMNDQIFVGSASSCYFDSVQPDSFWLRIRLQAMMDSQNTHVIVSYTEDAGDTFRECASMILEDAMYHEFQLEMYAETQSGMRQVVYDVTKKKPSVPKIDISGIEVRIDRIEERLRRLQNIVTEYIESHDRHVLDTLDRHSQLNSAIAATHNRIVTRSNAHGIIYLFLFGLVFICGLGYVRWKSGEEMRFHMP